MKKAVYPGSFDPITNGHLDILFRALKVFDEVTLLIADNPNKKSRFSVEERLEMVKKSVEGIKGAKVDATSGLTVDYANKIGAKHLVRGLREVTDFEYEFALADAYHKCDKDIDITFFMADESHSSISSSKIDVMQKEGKDISSLVPEAVNMKYKKR